MDAVIAKLEEEAAIACSAYDEQVTERDRLNEEIADMTAEKKSMIAQIEQEQGDLSSYQAELARANSEKSEKEDLLVVTQKKLADTEAKRNDMIEKKRRFEGDLSSFRKDIDDMNMQIQIQILPCQIQIPCFLSRIHIQILPYLNLIHSQILPCFQIHSLILPYLHSRNHNHHNLPYQSRNRPFHLPWVC